MTFLSPDSDQVRTSAAVSSWDPVRQSKRLPVRAVKMLTAHTGHLLHPEYLQPLTPAPLSIELDAKKSPLALLAQTCSQIGKPDSLSSKLNSHGEKESGGRSSGSKSGEARPPEDKSSFKPYNKSGGGESRRDGVSSSGSADKLGFRLSGNNASSNGNTGNGPQSYPNTVSPGSPGHPPPPKLSPGGRSSSRTPNAEHSPEQSSPAGGPGLSKKDPEKTGSDSPHLANSSQVRASANCSTSSADSHHEAGKVESSQSSQSGLGHVTPISPYKCSQPLFPLTSSGLGYHGSVVGSYPGYPSQFVPGLDHAKHSGLGGMGVPGKHPSSSHSPTSFMQGLCRDPYCLTYPGVSHLSGGNCNSCDPSSNLKSSFPLVYPSHPLHSLHPTSLPSSMPSSLPHPLYSYGFMLPNDPLPHACNWVSAGGPCEKRFGTSDELLAHLRTHTGLPAGMDSKLPSCHLHLPLQSSPGSMSLRAPPSLSLARYHPYSKVHLPPGPSSLSLHSLPASGPYYPHYALYSQRLGSASALGFQ